MSSTGSDNIGCGQTLHCIHHSSTDSVFVKHSLTLGALFPSGRDLMLQVMRILNQWEPKTWIHLKFALMSQNFGATEIFSPRFHLHMFSWRKMERGSDRILKQKCSFFSPFWSASIRIKVCCTVNPGNEYRNWLLSLLIIVIFEGSSDKNGLCQVFKFRKGVKWTREARSIECSLTASFCLSARNPPFSTFPLLYFPTKTLFSVQMYLPNFLPKKQEASGGEEHFPTAAADTSFSGKKFRPSWCGRTAPAC